MSEGSGISVLKHVEALFLTHARSLWVTGSPAGHGELCSTRPLGALGSFCRQYGTSGCPDPLQPAEKWGNDAALTPINRSPLMAPPEGTGLLATLGGLGREL